MTKSRFLLVAASAAISLLAPAAAMAETSAEFRAMDGNSDGIVSSGEHEDYAIRMFNLMDTNHDDKVTTEEVDASVGRVSGHAAGASGLNAAQRIRRRDVNADGIISRTEYETGARNKFSEMDVDDNGELTQQELDAGA